MEKVKAELIKWRVSIRAKVNNNLDTHFRYKYSNTFNIPVKWALLSQLSKIEDTDDVEEDTNDRKYEHEHTLNKKLGCRGYHFFVVKFLTIKHNVFTLQEFFYTSRYFTTEMSNCTILNIPIVGGEPL